MNLPVYDVVLLPAPGQYQLSIIISRRLERYGTDFTLADGEQYPHLSLYMANLTPENVEKAKAALAGIAAHTPPLSLEATGYVHDVEQGMFEVGYEKTDGIVRVQQAIIDAINPLRTGLREKDPVGRILADWLPQNSGEARENLERYGYDEIGELFRPHITCTRFKQRYHKADTAALPPPAALSAVFLTLGLYEMGEHGTCTRTVFTTPLAADQDAIRKSTLLLTGS
jgi:2'-5' RNA ligase